MKDMTGSPCDCGGIFERSILDDMDGLIRCNECGLAIAKYEKEAEFTITREVRDLPTRQMQSFRLAVDVDRYIVRNLGEQKALDLFRECLDQECERLVTEFKRMNGLKE